MLLLKPPCFIHDHVKQRGCALLTFLIQSLLTTTLLHHILE